MYVYIYTQSHLTYVCDIFVNFTVKLHIEIKIEYVSIQMKNPCTHVVLFVYISAHIRK